MQQRFDALEAEAKGRIRRALSAGNEKLMELDGALARVAKDGWSVTGARRHIEQLKVRAAQVRASAAKRVSGMPGEAVSRLANGTRAPVQNLARGLAEMAKKLEVSPRVQVVESPRNGDDVAQAS
jgi:hypothetical protein